MSVCPGRPASAPLARPERKGRWGRLVLKAPRDRPDRKSGRSWREFQGGQRFRSGVVRRGEIMASAYCAGGAAVRIDGTTGASCDGGAKAVIVCAKQ